MKEKLIIFDMDNTLLQSKIDFAFMKRTVEKILVERHLDRFIKPSTAATIMAYSQSKNADPCLIEQLWKNVSKIEAAGLQDSTLEPNVLETLNFLSAHFELSVLTNNSDYQLNENLGKLGLLPYLSCVAGRERILKLKPFPDGMLWIMNHFPQIPQESVVAIGDAIIDAEAAQAAGIKFIAYNNSRHENWEKASVKPLCKLTNWNLESCQKIMRLMSK